MKIAKEKMAAPVKFTVTVDETDLEERKQLAYEKIKHAIELPGFRKGNVPRDVAEERLGVEKIYKPVIDTIYEDVLTLEPSIVTSGDFKFFGDLKKKVPLTIEFQAEVKPEVILISLDSLKENLKSEKVEVTDEDLKGRIEFELKQCERIEDTVKEILENLDIAIIDFEGRLEGQDEPFKGGTAKGFQIRVNEIVNGRKQFVEGFEDQMIGMKLNETREVKVRFPKDYRDSSLADKNAIFKVVLKSIKFKSRPEYNEEFASSKGFNSLKDFEENLRNSIFQQKQRKAIDDFKKTIVVELINKSTISPIPHEMIRRENEKEWQSFLRRINKTEEQFLKENKTAKEYFYETNEPRSVEVIKASLILEKVANDFNITPTQQEVIDYVMRISKVLKHSPEKEEKLKAEMLNNQAQYRLMETATKNEKTIEFLYEYFK